MTENNQPPVTSVTEDKSTTSGANVQGIRLRAIIVGVLLAMAICALTPFNNIYRQATPLGGGHFPLAPFFILVWLTILVAVVQSLLRRTWLTGKELLVAWILMVLGSGIAYTGLVRTFFINITAPYHFATVENRWNEVLHPLLPAVWYPQSEKAIEELYNGFVGGRRMGWMAVIKQIPWHAWMMPLMVWTAFIFLCYFVMVCIVSLLSGQGLYNERMNFPLLGVPELMEKAMDEKRLWHFFSNRFLVTGMLVPIFLHLVNGLNFYIPAVPQIPTLILAGTYFPKYGLFSGFYKMKIYIYPAFIGFAFLAAKQISFSFWFFFILGGLLAGLLSVLGYSIPSAALGITFGPTLSHPDEAQVIGAYLVFFLFLFWLARQHLINVIKTGLNLRPGTLNDTEWIATRVSFWGFVIGGFGIVLWAHYFGIPFLFSIFVIGAFFMVTLVVTRLICQGGVAYYFKLNAAPMDGLLAFFGPKAFTSLGILVAAVTQKVLFLDLREALMPSLLHTSKVTHRVKNRLMIFWGILATLFGAVVVSYLAMLSLCYKFGIRELGLDWASQTTVAVYNNVFNLVETPVRPGPWTMVFIAAGAIVMLILTVCYHRFYWWPIHPIGYLLTYSSTMRIMWFCFFVGWLCNALCMRYGGVTLYKQLRLFFVGLIIGDFLMGGAWAIVGLFTFASYQVLPT